MIRHKKRYIVNFPKYMAICEFNYRRLTRLMPGWREPPKSLSKDTSTAGAHWQYVMGNTPHEMVLLIEVRNFAKYTTTVHISISSQLQKPMPWFRKYRSQCLAAELDSLHVLNAPDSNPFNRAIDVHHTRKIYSLDAHLYHDAVSAEVIAWQGRRGFQPKYKYPNVHMYQPDEKSQLNHFLGELLEFCLMNGRINQSITPLATPF